MPAELSLLYFAWVRERIGCDSERIAHPGPLCTVGELIDRLAARGGGYAEALADRSRLRAAVGQAHASLDSAIGDAEEVAIFPPVTGG